VVDDKAVLDRDLEDGGARRSCTSKTYKYAQCAYNCEKKQRSECVDAVAWWYRLVLCPFSSVIGARRAEADFSQI